MACGATLKRSHEFDSLHSPGRSPKRICGELISSPKPQCPTYTHPAAFVEAAQKLANGHHPFQTNVAISSNRTAHSFGASSHPCNITSSLSPGRLSTREDDSSRLMSPSSSRTASPTASSTTVSKDQAILSLAQVDLICRHIVEEHDNDVRGQFDRVLNDKLAEQYELFLKFNHDQLRRKFDDEMSDCSCLALACCGQLCCGTDVLYYHGNHADGA